MKSIRTIHLFFSSVSLWACADATPPAAQAAPASAATDTTNETAAQPNNAASTTPTRNAFDRAAAAATLAKASRDISACSEPNELQGEGHVRVTFAPDGHASDVEIDRPPFDTAPSSTCIKSVFQRCTVPPFDGRPIPVGKSFTLGNSGNPGAVNL